jgi:hypothetical protein
VTDLVAKALRGNNGNLIAETLVGLEIERQPGVVTLNDDLGRFLNSLIANRVSNNFYKKIKSQLIISGYSPLF